MNILISLDNDPRTSCDDVQKISNSLTNSSLWNFLIFRNAVYRLTSRISFKLLGSLLGIIDTDYEWSEPMSELRVSVWRVAWVITI